MMKITKNNFLNLPVESSSYDNSKVLIVPFGLEKGVSYGHGTKNGPSAIIKASQDVELFDEEIKSETYRDFGIATLASFKIESDTKKSLAQLEEIVDDVLRYDKFPVILGGEHTLTLGAVRAILKKYTPLTVLQFDAHADFRDSYLGNNFSHACVMRRVLELVGINLVQVGIRNISNNQEDGFEYDFLQKNKNKITTFWAKDKDSFDNKKLIESLGKNVYISFDVDVFDLSIMPSTGTPEPGGLNWYEVINILRAVSKSANVVGMDFVEFSPIKGLIAPDFLVAKLIYKSLNYCFSKK